MLRKVLEATTGVVILGYQSSAGSQSRGRSAIQHQVFVSVGDCKLLDKHEIIIVQQYFAS